MVYDALNDGFQVIFYLANVRTRFEVIPTPVRSQTPVQDMKLSDTPPIEALLTKQVVEHVFPTYLYVAFP